MSRGPTTIYCPESNNFIVGAASRSSPVLVMEQSSKTKAVPKPEDNVEPLNYREQFAGREVITKFVDPCAAASKASLDCLNRNDYNRDACLEYFQAYRDCKGTWMKQRKDDRRAGMPEA